MTIVPSPTVFAAIGLRFVEVRDNNFAPVVNRGDFVMIASADGWRGDGDYLVELVSGEPALYRCSAFGTGAKPILMGRPNPSPLYRAWPMSIADFEARVVGIIVAFMQVKQPALLREFIPAI